MTIGIWDDTYWTGDRFVDAQHQELFQLVNELHDAIVAGRGKEVLTSALSKVTNYTVEHFEEEECLMSEMHYPDLCSHKRKHQGLTEKVMDLAEKFQAGKMTLPITLSHFLRNWLSHHIREDDIAFIKYVQAQRGSGQGASTAVIAPR